MLGDYSADLAQALMKQGGWSGRKNGNNRTLLYLYCEVSFESSASCERLLRAGLLKLSPKLELLEDKVLVAALVTATRPSTFIWT